MIKRAIRIILATLLIVSGTVTLQKSIFKNPQHLNLLLISVDTLRPDHMGIYGYMKNTTPNIDKWAKNATVFTNVSTVVPLTAPSFSALMTGLTPFNTRIFKNYTTPISPNTKTLSSILKENGYSTAVFTPGGLASPESGLDQGFDEIYTQHYKFFYNDENGLERYQQDNREKYEQLIKQAGDWLSNNAPSSDKKFFLWIHLLDPHAPYFPPDDLKCKFNQKYCDTILGKSLDELDEERARYQMCQDEKVPQDVIERMETLYDGGVAYSDRLVGKILDKLKQTGLDKNTLVILYGDHGEGFDHNYYFNHRKVLYDSSIKIPLIIKLPQINSGKKTNRLIDNTDIAPTILDLLGIGLKGLRIDGKSFSNELLRFAKNEKKEFIYSTNNTLDKFSISDGRYKYIYSLPESCLLEMRTEELYDTKTDPKEIKNIAMSKINIKDRLKSKLLETLALYNLPKTSVDSPNNINTKLDDLKTLGY